MDVLYCKQCKELNKISLILDGNIFLESKCLSHHNKILISLRENIIPKNLEIKKNINKYEKFCLLCEEPILKDNNKSHIIHNIYNINKNKLSKIEIEKLNDGIKRAVQLINNNINKYEDIIRMLTLKLKYSLENFKNIFQDEINLLNFLKDTYIINEKNDSLNYNIINNLRNLINFDFREFKSIYENDIISCFSQFNFYLNEYSKKGFIIPQKKKHEKLKKYNIINNNDINLKGTVTDFIYDKKHLFIITDEKFINILSKNLEFISRKELNDDIYFTNLIEENKFIFTSDKINFCSFQNNEIIINQKYDLSDIPKKIIVTTNKNLLIMFYFYLSVFVETKNGNYQKMISLINTFTDIIELIDGNFSTIYDNNITIWDKNGFNLINQIKIKNKIVNANFIKCINNIIVIQDKNEIISFDIKENKINNNLLFSSNIQNIKIFKDIYLIISPNYDSLIIYNIMNFSKILNLRIRGIKNPIFLYEKNSITWVLIMGNCLKEIKFQTENES